MSRLFVLAAIVAIAASGACRKASTPADSKTAASHASPASSAGSKGDAPAPAAPKAPEAPLPPMPVPKELPAVVARVNDEDIKKADFDLLVRNVEITNRAPIPAERRDAILRRVLDDLVTYTVLKQEAKARSIAVTEVEVEERMKVMRKSAPNDEAFNRALAQRKMTLARLRADTRVEIAIAKMMDSVVTAQPPTDADAKAFYEKNPDRFKHPDLVRASHIMVRFDPAGGEASKAQVRAKAEALLKRARAGEDFAALARQYSEHASAPGGGDLKFFPREPPPGSILPRQFSEAAFALQPGQTSDLVATENGYHIIKVTDRKPAGILPLADVNDRIKEGLTQQKSEAFVAGLRQKAKIEVLI